MRAGAAISRLTTRATQCHMTEGMETSARTPDTSTRGRSAPIAFPTPSTPSEPRHRDECLVQALKGNILITDP